MVAWQIAMIPARTKPIEEKPIAGKGPITRLELAEATFWAGAVGSSSLCLGARQMIKTVSSRPVMWVAMQ